MQAMKKKFAVSFLIGFLCLIDTSIFAVEACHGAWVTITDEELPDEGERGTHMLKRYCQLGNLCHDHEWENNVSVCIDFHTDLIVEDGFNYAYKVTIYPTSETGELSEELDSAEVNLLLNTDSLTEESSTASVNVDIEQSDDEEVIDSW